MWSLYSYIWSVKAHVRAATAAAEVRSRSGSGSGRASPFGTPPPPHRSSAAPSAAPARGGRDPATTRANAGAGSAGSAGVGGGAGGLPCNLARGLFDMNVQLARDVREYATQEHVTNRNVALESVYLRFREMRKAVHDTQARANAARVPFNDVMGHGELGHILLAFENFRIHRDYSSPRSARRYLKVAGAMFPLVLAPAFASLGAHEEDQAWNAYFVAATTSLMYGLLIGVQDTLDDPFNSLQANAEDGTQTIYARTDAVDLSRLEYYPFLSMDGTVDVNGVECVAQATLGGGPTPELRPHVSTIFTRMSETLQEDAEEAGGRAGRGKGTAAPPPRQRSVRTLWRPKDSRLSPGVDPNLVHLANARATLASGGGQRAAGNCCTALLAVDDEGRRLTQPDVNAVAPTPTASEASMSKAPKARKAAPVPRAPTGTTASPHQPDPLPGHVAGAALSQGGTAAAAVGVALDPQLHPPSDGVAPVRTTPTGAGSTGARPPGPAATSTSVATRSPSLVTLQPGGSSNAGGAGQTRSRATLRGGEVGAVGGRRQIAVSNQAAAAVAILHPNAARALEDSSASTQKGRPTLQHALTQTQTGSPIATLQDAPTASTPVHKRGRFTVSSPPRPGPAVCDETGSVGGVRAAESSGKGDGSSA